MTPSQLKAALAIGGLRLDASAQSGRQTVSEAIELELPRHLAVSARVITDGEPAPYVLTTRAGRSFVEDTAGEAPAVPVEQGPPPRFYERSTSQGTPMAKVGSIRGHHLVLSPGGACGFSVRGTPCPFCLEGARASGSRAAHVHPTRWSRSCAPPRPNARSKACTSTRALSTPTTAGSRFSPPTSRPSAATSTR
jgi:hypothetical protein